MLLFLVQNAKCKVQNEGEASLPNIIIASQTRHFAFCVQHFALFWLYFSLVFIKYSLIIFKIYCIMNLQNVPDAKGRYSPENKGRKIKFGIRNAKFEMSFASVYYFFSIILYLIFLKF